MDTLSPHADHGNLFPLKRCTKCGDEFPATPEFFYHHKSRDTLESQCKVCVRKRVKAYAELPGSHEKEQARGKAYRSRSEVQERLHTYKQAYYSQPENREHHRNYQSMYYNRPDIHEHYLAQMKDYQNRPEVQERIYAYRRLPESRARNNVRHQISYRRPEVKARILAHTHTRLARKKAVSGTYTATQIADLLKRQHYRCYYAACGHIKFQRVNGKYKYHIDHTFPLSRVAGTDIPANDISYLVLTCPTCNLRKNDKFPWEFPEGGRLL